MYEPASDNNKTCMLCGSIKQLECTDLPGYMAGQYFSLWCCSGCRTVHADPLQGSDDVYEAIYRQPELIPGYARYYGYAEAITGQRRPLAWLCDREPAYWGLATSLLAEFPDRSATVLEAGCGLGYLTYALSKSGFSQVRGIDLSADAVASAARRYGCDYRQANISDYAEQTSDRFDAVVMSEVIEHLPDPVSFVTAALRLLRPGGVLILTTPNRDFGGHQTQLWSTDLPPVHLWWFGRRGLTELAARSGATLTFCDFSPWNNRHRRAHAKALLRSDQRPDFRPLLDADGQPLIQAKRRPPVAKQWRRDWKNRLINLWQSPPVAPFDVDSPILCATLRPR